LAKNIGKTFLATISGLTKRYK